jgi:hypothetical protein
LETGFYQNNFDQASSNASRFTKRVRHHLTICCLIRSAPIQVAPAVLAAREFPRDPKGTSIMKTSFTTVALLVMCALFAPSLAQAHGYGHGHGYGHHGGYHPGYRHHGYRHHYGHVRHYHHRYW